MLCKILTHEHYLSTPNLQKPHRKGKYTKWEGVRYKQWREHTWEESLISSQVRSQSSSRWKQQEAGLPISCNGTSDCSGAKFTRVKLGHSQCPLSTYWKYSSQAYRCTGVLLIHRLIWDFLPMPILYLNPYNDKKPPELEFSFNRKINPHLKNESTPWSPHFSYSKAKTLASAWHIKRCKWKTTGFSNTYLPGIKFGTAVRTPQHASRILCFALANWESIEHQEVEIYTNISPFNQFALWELTSSC